jgi:hypothetical protein
MRASLSCKLVDRLAVRFFFAGLPEELGPDMRGHFAQCPRCRRKLRLFERVWRWDAQRRAEEPRQDVLSITDDPASMSGLSRS